MANVERILNVPVPIRTDCSDLVVMMKKEAMWEWNAHPITEKFSENPKIGPQLQRPVRYTQQLLKREEIMFSSHHIRNPLLENNST